jgi:hypothetical protein
VPASIYLTVGTPDANGATANSVGSYRIDVVPGDLHFSVSATDVRCLPATAATVCAGANAADGPDYSGLLQAIVPFRLTDHDNGPATDEPGTVFDLPFTVDVNCTPTTDTSIGAACVASTTANAIIPGSVQVGDRAIWQLDQVAVYDGGADGNPHQGDPAGGILLRQGVFIP